MKEILKHIVEELKFEDIDIFEMNGELFIYIQDRDVVAIMEQINEKLLYHNLVLLNHTLKMATVQPLKK